MLDRITRNEVKLFLFIMHYPGLTQHQIGLIYKEAEEKDPGHLSVKLGEEGTLSEYLQRLIDRKLIVGERNKTYEVSSIPFITPLNEHTPTIRGHIIKPREGLVSADRIDYFFSQISARPESPITPTGVRFTSACFDRDKKGKLHVSTKSSCILDSPVPEEQLKLIFLIEERREGSIYDILRYIRTILYVFVKMFSARESEYNTIAQEANHDLGLKIKSSHFNSDDIRKLWNLHHELGEFYKYLSDSKIK